MFSGGSVLWSSENTASSLMMQTNVMQNFSSLLNHTYNLYGGSTCLPILSPKPVAEHVKRCLTDKSTKYKLVSMFSCGSVLWSSENTALSLMMQTNLMQNFSALLSTQSYLQFFFGGSTCLPILSPKPVAESASVDFIGRRRLRASFI